MAEMKASLVSFGWPLGKRCRSQTSRVTLAKSRRCNNSSGDDLACHLRLAGLVKLLARSLESLTHRCDHLRFEYSGSDEWTNWHGSYPPPQLSARAKLEREVG
jgi:hypothetical protein